MIPQGHAVISRIAIDQSLVGKANNLVGYTLIVGNNDQRHVIRHIQPFDFEVFTARKFSTDKLADLQEAYFEDLQRKIDAQKKEEIRVALAQVQATLEDRVRIFETKSHSVGVIAPSYSQEPIQRVIGGIGLVSKTTQVRNLFRAPLTLARFDGQVLLPTSIPLDISNIEDELMICDIETTNYDLKELKEKEMHAPYDHVYSLYKKECKLHDKKPSKKHLSKTQLLSEIHALRNDGKKKRLSGTMLANSRETNIITEVAVPVKIENVNIIVTQNPGRIHNEILARVKPLFVSQHYGLGFDNPEFDSLTDGDESFFAHNTKGGSTHIYARKSSLDIDTYGARHLPGITNGKLPTLLSVYSGIKTRKPMTHPELEQAIKLAITGDLDAIAKVTNYMMYDVNAQRRLTSIVAKPILQLARIFETTPVSLASSDPSTIIKSYIERKFERMHDISFFPKYMWDLKRELDTADLKEELYKFAAVEHPLEPGLHNGTLVWCHPQVSAVAKQIKSPALKELFEARENATGALKQFYTTFAKQFSEYHILHARLMSSKAFAYALDRFNTDAARISLNYLEECSKVRSVIHDAIGFDGNLALLAPGTKIPDDMTFTTIGEGRFFVHDYSTFIGEVDGVALRRTNIADPSSKAGIKSYLEQKIMYQFYGEYFEDPILALSNLNEHIVDIRDRLSRGDISDLFINHKLKRDPPKIPKTRIHKIAVAQGLGEGDVVKYRDDVDEIKRDLFETTRDCKPIGTMATIAYMAGIRSAHLHDFLTKRVTPQPINVSRGIQQELF